MSTEHYTVAVEVWKDVPGFDGYQVSDQGRVRTRRLRGSWGVGKFSSEWRLMTPRIRDNGRLQVIIGGKTFPVHRLVLFVFVGPCPAGMETLHHNDNPRDNRLSNLSWGTREQNTADKRRNNRIAYGERNSGAKITDKDVVAIRHKFLEGSSYEDLANEYGLSVAHVAKIICGQASAHLPGAVRQKQIRRLTEPEFENICRLCLAGISNQEIATLTGSSVGHVKRIRGGYQWKKLTK